ncbi:hypothetical protein NSB25_08250 [Acetatifactor muris]|jgi:hypothetical protein|uniref:Glycosyltransferase RgtA/B/C/D-like domain-containing protein n=1 Tax=Acetatifactor muris TaxID=879566 RepID=A0A2K4ZF33_9FIRM|nr:hypothetical protein [Acetatifactor muris]MCI8799192.1 hypothetical protein [Lachnospiraceae bacterium]MCR2047265.1 hypothetical protein [Acetatifactor muris]SOY29070.1 hypothetical protein AMURIS_01785 [Acetatifactor muris]
MLKIEKKLLLWTEKHMFLLMAVLGAAVALYLRRTAIWWSSPEVVYYFDGHGNNIQSSFYFLVIQLFQHLPILPLHGIKWLAGLADYVAAVLCFVAVRGYKEQCKLKSTFYFIGCLLSPVVFLRGICWAQIDSVAFSLLLGAYLLWKKEKYMGAVLLAIPGAVLYPCFFPVVLFLMWHHSRGMEGKVWIYAGVFAAGCYILSGASSVLTGQPWGDGILSCIRWTSYDPYTGELYRDPLLWVKQMVNLFGYGAAMVSGIAAYRHKLSYKNALLIQLAVSLVYGSLLFPLAE